MAVGMVVIPYVIAIIIAPLTVVNGLEVITDVMASGIEVIAFVISLPVVSGLIS
jgi:hypothetical protein